MLVTAVDHVFARKRDVPPPVIALFATMLFALPSVRNLQPGVPPIGASVDIIGFYW